MCDFSGQAQSYRGGRALGVNRALREEMASKEGPIGQMIGRWIRGATLAPLALLTAGMAFAQEDDVAARLAALEETVAGSASAYVDNSYLFLIGGLIVMFMAAGFCMLEAGLVRSKNAAMQSTKNVTLFAVAGLMFWLTGYNLAYPG